MKVLLNNHDPNSSSGPNNFTNKLFHYLTRNYDVEVTHDSNDEYDVELCLIESNNEKSKPRVLRLDGIYFNSTQDYTQQNSNILKTYNDADAVVYQSEFDKQLIETWFGSKDKYDVIHNATLMELINQTPKFENELLSTANDVWLCASSWRPHKRLTDNVRYFQENKSKNDIMIVAGQNAYELNDIVDKTDVYYIEHLPWQNLISVMKVAKYFVHLSWLDHCPNVVIDAVACGCNIICSNAGGTVEIAPPGSVIINEKIWDFKPVELYDPPKMNFNDRYYRLGSSDTSMETCAAKYYELFKSLI